jgi:hypothetical protein
MIDSNYKTIVELCTSNFPVLLLYTFCIIDNMYVPVWVYVSTGVTVLVTIALTVILIKYWIKRCAQKSETKPAPIPANLSSEYNVMFTVERESAAIMTMHRKVEWLSRCRSGNHRDGALCDCVWIRASPTVPFVYTAIYHHWT